MVLELVRYKCSKYHRKAHNGIGNALCRDGLKLHAASSTLDHRLCNESHGRIGRAGISRGGSIPCTVVQPNTPIMSLQKNEK